MGMVGYGQTGYIGSSMSEDAAGEIFPQAYYDATE